MNHWDLSQISVIIDILLGITEEQLQASLIGLGADGASVGSGDAGGEKHSC